MAGFTAKQKLEHYKGVASGTIKPKKDSKFTKKEQQSYAAGQVHARMELTRTSNSNKKKKTNRRSSNYRG